MKILRFPSQVLQDVRIFRTISGTIDVETEKAGLVKSIRGANGGYVLAKEAKDISVGDVLRALEGNLEPVECAGLDPEGECKGADSCVTKYVWKRINDSINQTVDEIWLNQLVTESKCHWTYRQSSGL